MKLPPNEDGPNIRRLVVVGKTWRLDWDIALARWLKRLLGRKKKWKS